MFWSTLIELCDQKNMKPNQVGKELGISSASFTKWKNGSTPTLDALMKLSEYFNVSIDYLAYGNQDANGRQNFIKVGPDAIIVTDQNERLLIQHYRALHYVNQIKVLSFVIEESEKEK